MAVRAIMDASDRQDELERRLCPLATCFTVSAPEPAQLPVPFKDGCYAAGQACQGQRFFENSLV